MQTQGSAGGGSSPIGSGGGGGGDKNVTGVSGGGFPGPVVKAELEHRDGQEQATKADAGKVQIGLYPTRALISTCEVFTFGANKYDVGNWHRGDGFAWSRPYHAVFRHLLFWSLGNDRDEESGLPILGHAACELAMLLEHQLGKFGQDDRAKMQRMQGRK